MVRVTPTATVTELVMMTVLPAAQTVLAEIVPPTKTSEACRVALAMLPSNDLPDPLVADTR